MSLPAWILSALLAASVAAASCSDDDDGASQTATATATGQPQPSPSVDSSVLPTPPPGLAARFLDPEEVLPAHISSAEYESYLALVDELMADVDEFWGRSLEPEAGHPWEPPDIVERTPDTPLQCDETDVQAIRGSFFCPADNFVVFEESRQLLPLYLQVGPYAVAMVIAHEFGHAVQRSVGITYVGSEEQELQADCFAGVWFANYGASGAFDDPEEPFLQAYAAMRTVTSGRDLPERYDALSAGYLEGIEPCLELVPEDESEQASQD